ncbi:MAG: 7-cyano-7-deazaguanine synthase [Nanoarchaeota archaeon]|nr:7-cyano-7-deazaguanine synthase [Nanoarchaeota archaeon]
MEIHDLVDFRYENSVVIVTTDDTVVEHDFFPNRKCSFYLNFRKFPIQNQGVIKQFRDGFRQDFYLENIINELLPQQFQSSTASWAYNLFLTALGIARAETLGAKEVYIPNSFFTGIVQSEFYKKLNTLIDEGTNKHTQIEIKPSLSKGIAKPSHLVSQLENKSLILASGGTDNTVAATIEKKLGRSIGLLQVIYQQAARHQERWCIDRLKEDLDAIELKRIEFDVLKHYGGSALLRDDIQLKEGNLELEYVPFRNSIFITLGLILASSKDYSSIVLGAHPDDTMAPDGTRSYIQAFNDVLKAFIFDTPEIRAPLLNFGGKPELIELGIDLGVNFKHTWSCHTYVPKTDVGYNAKACGTCGNCITRYSAFKKLGLEDPVGYIEEPKLRTKWAGKQEDYDNLRKILLLSNS